MAGKSWDTMFSAIPRFVMFIEPNLKSTASLAHVHGTNQLNTTFLYNVDFIFSVAKSKPYNFFGFGFDFTTDKNADIDIPKWWIFFPSHPTAAISAFCYRVRVLTQQSKNQNHPSYRT